MTLTDEEIRANEEIASLRLWNGGAILKLAEQIRQTGDHVEVAILKDMMIEARCGLPNWIEHMGYHGSNPDDVRMCIVINWIVNGYVS